MVNDPIGDMLIQIKNASMTGRAKIALPYSRLKYEVALLLAKEEYVSSVAKSGTEPKQVLEIALKYHGKDAALTDVKRRSKPGLRVYVGATEIPTVVGGLGVAVLSTPKGIMSGKEARQKHLGGELLCEIW